MKVNGKDFTIGADPEVFVQHNNKFVSAHDLVPGDKENPFLVPKGAVQVDGMALEFNIDPASSYEEFQDNLTSVQDTLAGMIGDKKFLKDVTVNFDEEFSQSVPAFNRVLGCSADYNGWTGKENDSPDGDQMKRTAGGHVHIGGFTSKDPFNPNHYKNCARLSRILDHTLGAYSILWDKDDERRSMYGQAGSFRPKTYGMEYRTLSNAWIFDEKLTKFVYEGVQRALKFMFVKGYEPDEQARNIINNSDRNSSFFKGNPLTLGLAA